MKKKVFKIHHQKEVHFEGVGGWVGVTKCTVASPATGCGVGGVGAGGDNENGDVIDDDDEDDDDDENGDVIYDDEDDDDNDECNALTFSVGAPP